MLFQPLKMPLWESTIAATIGSGSRFELVVSRGRAQRWAASGRPDTEGRHTVFSQCFRALSAKPPTTLRRHDQLFQALFAGERAHDVGGPYRETIGTCIEDVMSSRMDLFLPTPNAVNNVGSDRDKWIPNPSATSRTSLAMYAFLGQLMGIAIRQKQYVELKLPSLVWKMLCDSRPTVDDLVSIDKQGMKALERVLHDPQITADTFEYIIFETFETTALDGRTVELIPGGSRMDVTWENRRRWVELIVKHRLSEVSRQVDAIKAGLATIVPRRLLSLFQWRELERLVCGSGSIDVTLLREATDYRGYSSDDATVRLFWETLESFSQDDRARFLKFVWGRTTLPLRVSEFSQRFRLERAGMDERHLPVAHTCFFSLDLPPYSTAETMRKRLEYAIYNCTAIDGDDTSTGMRSAGMGLDYM
jgi:hypothetical protein